MKIKAFMVFFLITMTSVYGIEVSIKKNVISSGQLPQVAILDVMSDGYGAGNTRVLTDFLRTELFKIKTFQIIERGVIENILEEQKFSVSGIVNDSALLKIGQLLAVEKLFVTTVGKFSNTTVLNVRIIDVSTSLVDYTENVFIKDENLIFDSVKDVVKQVQLHYAVPQENEEGLSLEDEKANQLKQWFLLGAGEDDAEYLLSSKIKPQTYLSIRQYDISFKMSDFVKVIKAGWEPEAIRNFLTYGISYPLTEKALSYGIVDLTNYNQYFKPEGISFEEYLDAYANHLVTPEEYLEFKKGYRKDRLVIGIGGVADKLPVANADFKFLLGRIAWEHYWTKYQRDLYKISSEAGVHLMGGIVPVPFYAVNAYVGNYPFYFKLGGGILTEVVLGGHVGFFLRPGFEVFEKFEFDLTIVWGTQPNVSYVDFETKIDDPAYIELGLPYIAAEFLYKF